MRTRIKVREILNMKTTCEVVLQRRNRNSFLTVYEKCMYIICISIILTYETGPSHQRKIHWKKVYLVWYQKRAMYYQNSVFWKNICKPEWDSRLAKVILFERILQNFFNPNIFENMVGVYYPTSRIFQICLLSAD